MSHLLKAIDKEIEETLNRLNELRIQRKREEAKILGGHQPPKQLAERPKAP